MTANGYGLYPVTVAYGFVYTDDNGHYYAGTLSDDEKTAIARTTMSPVPTYSVSIADGITNGSVTVARSYAAAGENVILTVTPNTFYTVESVSYNDGSDHTITPVGDVYSFVMPAADVTVSATFSTSISFDTATDVSYIDANGVAQTAPTVNLLTQTSTKLLAGWYMAASDVTIKGDVRFAGDIHLILTDGVTLTINGKLWDSDIYFDDNFNIVGSDLTIYRQSDGTGCLNTSGILTKTVTINGGVVTSAADENGTSIFGYDIVINGGQVTAEATGEYGGRIVADNTITLGYSRADDFVHATSFAPLWGYVTITIKDGQSFYNGSEVLSGTVSDKSKLNGKTLRPFKEITLANDDNNTSAISNWNGGVAKVTLSDRTLYKDGNWNTLCLPFDVTDGNNTDDITFSGTPLAGATARTMTNAIISGSTLELTFGEEVTTMTAGVPYIIKWASGDNIVNPEFNYVTIKSALQPVVNGNIEFQGSYAPVGITAQEGDNTLLYLGAGNTLYWPNSPMTIGAQRAVFKLKGGITVGDPSDPNVHVRAFNLSFGDEDEETGILSTTDDTDFTDSDDAWYTLDGRKLSGKPSQRGVYIHGGRKVAIQ